VISVIGHSSLCSVGVSGILVMLVFVDVSVSGSSPVQISRSSVVLIAVGANHFLSRSSAHAGVECSVESNITLQAVHDG
jgi:hypothetical protein